MHPSYILYNKPEPGSLADSALSKLPHDELTLVLAAMHPEDLLNLAVVSRDLYVLVATDPLLLERLGLRYRLPPNSDRDADMDPFNLGQLRKHLRATTFDPPVDGDNNPQPPHVSGFSSQKAIESRHAVCRSASRRFTARSIYAAVPHSMCAYAPTASARRST